MVRLVIFVQFFESLDLLWSILSQFTTIHQAFVKSDHSAVFGNGQFDSFLQVFDAFFFPGSLGAATSQIIEQIGIFFHLFLQFAETRVRFVIIFIRVIADSQVV